MTEELDALSAWAEAQPAPAQQPAPRFGPALHGVPARRYRCDAGKMSSVVPDNGLIHYGLGVHTSYCGCQTEGRLETIYAGVATCPGCIKFAEKRR